MYERENREIDLCSLIVNNLECESSDVTAFALFNDKNIELVERKFETIRIWMRAEQTSYIESIFLQCGLQPIIRYQNSNNTFIIDGYNRYLSIKNFCENKLVLDIKGLKQLKFLAGKSYDTIGNTGRDYFSKRTPNMVTIKLACLFYYKDFTNINLTNYSNRRVTSWLNEFNEKKQQYMFKTPEKIAELRNVYISSFDEVMYFYEKISDFLDSVGKFIRDLFVIDCRASIPVSSYYYLFCMLGDFPKNELINNSQKIYDIIHDFFTEIKLNKLDSNQRIKLLEFAIQRIMIFNSSRKYEIEDKKRYEFMEKVGHALNR